jgi:DNA-binding transcriptional MocR family regulator
VLRSGGGVSPFGTAVLRDVLASGLQDDVLRRLTALYARRRAVLVEALTDALPPGVRFRPPEGGYYIWIGLPEGTDAEALAAVAPAHGVGFRPGSVFSVDGGQRSWLRVCFTYYGEDALRTAAARLGAFLADHLSTHGEGRGHDHP